MQSKYVTQSIKYKKSINNKNNLSFNAYCIAYIL